MVILIPYYYYYKYPCLIKDFILCTLDLPVYFFNYYLILGFFNDLFPYLLAFDNTLSIFHAPLPGYGEYFLTFLGLDLKND